MLKAVEILRLKIARASRWMQSRCVPLTTRR